MIEDGDLVVELDVDDIAIQEEMAVARENAEAEYRRQA